MLDDGDLIGMAASASIPLDSVPVGPDGLLRPLSGATPGGIAGLTTGADAEAELVKALVNHQLVLSKKASEAAAFLFTHDLGDVAAFCLELRKYHQRPSGLRKALDALSLKEFMRGLQVDLSNGK